MAYTMEQLQKALANATKGGDKEAVTEIQAAIDEMKPGFLASVGKGDLPGAWDAWNREIAGDPPVLDAAVEGTFNIPKSGAQTVMDTIVTPIMHPITTGKALATVGSGALEYAGAGLKSLEPEWLKPYVSSKYDLDKPTPEMEAAAEVGKGLVHRGVHWRETMRDDPVGGLMDAIGTIMGGAGAAARVPGRVGREASRVARVAENLQMSNLVTKPAYGIIKHLPFVGEEAAMARMRRTAPSREEVDRIKDQAYADVAAAGSTSTPAQFRDLEAGLQTAASNYTPSQITGAQDVITHQLTGGRNRGLAPMRQALAEAQAELDRAEQALRASIATRSPNVAQDQAEVARRTQEVAARQAAVAQGPTATAKQLDDARRDALAVNIPGSQRADRALANTVVDRIDDVMDTFPDSATMRRGREYGRRSALHNVLEVMQSHGTHGTAGYESMIRNQVASYLKKRGHTLTPTETRSFESIVAREGAKGVAHTLASRLGLLAGTAGGIAGTQNPVLGLLAAVGANVGTRAMMARATRSDLDKAMQTVLAGRERQAIAASRAHLRRTIGRGLARGASAAGTAYGMMTE